MTGIHITACARSDDLCHAQAARTADKWQLFDLLTAADPRLGLGHRTLSVLRALLTFLPDRDIPDGGPAAVVFPANRTLSHRLAGMPESTLRRHLSKLVQAGVIARRDSPNGKRYARNMGNRIGIAFGFDLSPLMRMADPLMTLAADVTEERERLEILRQQILVRLTKLTEDDPLQTAARRILRRVPDEETLRQMLCQLPEAKVVSEEMSGTDSQNGRHLQELYQSNLVSDHRGQPDDPQIALTEFDGAGREYRTYYPEGARTWADLAQLAEKIGPMIGINGQTLTRTRLDLGDRSWSIAVLSILDRLPQIRSPGAFLAGLAKRQRAGRLNLRALAGLSARPAFVS